MENMLENPHVGMVFLIPGFFDVLRVNGRGSILTSTELLAGSAVDDKAPRSGLLVGVEEVFFHCGRALKRARLWEQDAQRSRSELPKLADMMRDQLAPVDEASPEALEELDELAQESYLDRLY
jgi:predicted pyridoxine 5'-phosphate oxidase superfamily flavin-nucleotide-binding protein